MPSNVMPFSERPLLRTHSVAQAQAGGARLLAQHRLLARDAGFDACINGVSLAGLSVYYMRYGVPLTVIGAPPESFVAVTLPLRGSMRVEHEGRSFVAEAGRSAAVLSPGSPIRLDWSADLEFFCFRIDVAALQAYASSLGPDDDMGEAVRFEPCMTGRAGLSGLLGCAWLIERACQRRQANRYDDRLSALQARLGEQAMTALLLAQPQRTPSPVPGQGSPVSRWAALRAQQYAEESKTVVPTPSQLAAQLGVSLRTLQLGFHEELGTTPQAFLTDVRLRRAHSELVRASTRQGTTVAAVAARWGFSNVGRFAEKYQAAYGCKPSETLRTARTRG